MTGNDIRGLFDTTTVRADDNVCVCLLDRLWKGKAVKVKDGDIDTPEMPKRN